MAESHNVEVIVDGAVGIPATAGPEKKGSSLVESPSLLSQLISTKRTQSQGSVRKSGAPHRSLGAQARAFRWGDQESGEWRGWVFFTSALLVMLAANVPLFVLSFHELSVAPTHTLLHHIYRGVEAAYVSLNAGSITKQQYDAVVVAASSQIQELMDASAAVWTYTLASFGTTVGVLLPCAAILFWLREEPDIRAYGRIFLVQFVLGLLLFNIFDIVYVGAALLQIYGPSPSAMEDTRNLMYAMKLCRTVLGSLSFSCFCMRQRVIYKIFNKLAVDGQRVYLEAFAFFEFVAVLSMIPQTVATFADGQSEARYQFLSTYLMWATFTVPFYWWTLRTLQASRRFNDYVSNIRSHLLITLMSMSALIYTTVNPESILSVIGIGYSMRVGLAIHAIELALKALYSRFRQKTPSRSASLRRDTQTRQSGKSAKQLNQSKPLEPPKSEKSEKEKEAAARPASPTDNVIPIDV